MHTTQARSVHLNLTGLLLRVKRLPAMLNSQQSMCPSSSSTACTPCRWMGLILDFLSLPWEDSVLHHEQAINKPGGVRVSIKERSSDQIIKPINLDALTQWVGTFPEVTPILFLKASFLVNLNVSELQLGVPKFNHSRRAMYL